MTEKEMVRINTRISSVMNDWLDERSKETGLSKSAIVMLAVENYYSQTEVMKNMANMAYLMDKLEQIESRLPSEDPRNSKA